MDDAGRRRVFPDLDGSRVRGLHAPKARAAHPHTMWRVANARRGARARRSDASWPVSDLDFHLDLRLRRTMSKEETSASDLKAKGNAYFLEKKYNEAIATYSDAIALDSSNAVLFCNRAASYLGLEQYV